MINLLLLLSGMSTIAGATPALQGRWGGLGIQLDITDSAASLRYDCADAVINTPISADSDGVFDLAGVYTFEKPVVHPGDPADSHPARFPGFRGRNCRR